MSLLQIACVGIGSYVIINILVAIIEFSNKEFDNWEFSNERNDILKTKKLFLPSIIFYFFLNLICFSFNNSIVQWIILIFGCLWGIVTGLHFFDLFLQFHKMLFKHVSFSLILLATFISGFVPIFMAINIYFAYIK